MEKSFGRWQVTDSDLADICPEKARELLIKCFFEAQKETISISKRATIGWPSLNLESQQNVRIGKLIEMITHPKHAPS